MVRIAYALGMLALAMSGFVGFVAALDWSRAGPRFAEIQEYLGPAGALREGADALTSHSAEASPLIVQAQALAHYLNPPVSSETRASTISTPATNLTLPSLPSRPTAPSAKFRLYGTSCYPNQPSRSMALISEIGSAEGSERWVKEGFQVDN